MEKLHQTIEEMSESIKQFENENRTLLDSEKSLTQRLETVSHNYEKAETQLQNLQDGKQSDGSTLTDQWIEISRLSTEKEQLEKEISSWNQVIESKEQIIEAKNKDIDHITGEMDQVSANFSKA